MPTPFFVIFIAFHCVLSSFEPNFDKFGPRIINSIQFWWGFGKSTKKTKKVNYENDIYENGKWGSFTDIP